MRRIQKFPFFFAIVLAGIFLYLVGDLEAIQPDTRVFSNSFLLLILIHIFFFSSLTFFLYNIFVILSKRKAKNYLFLIISGLLACIFTLFTINPLFFDTQHFVSEPYIIVGNILRDQYGINWYFMDWGGWMVTIILYCLPFYTYIMYVLLTFLARLKK